MDQTQQLTLLLPLLAAGALLIPVGQALAAVGTSRSKNAASAISRSLCNFLLTVLVFSLIGIRLLTYHPAGGWRGIDPRIPINRRALTLQFAMMALIATGLIAPAVAERSRKAVPLLGSLLIALLLFPLFGHWVWFGWLARMGFIDVAGAVPLHLAGALCGIAAAWCVGARNGKYNHDGSTSIIPAHQAAMPGLATLLMIAGWLPYVTGSAAMRESELGLTAVACAAIDALVAAAAGGLGAMLLVRWRSARDDLSAVCAGLLGGAVAMTAAGGCLAIWQAAVLGLVAGFITPVVSQWLDFKCRIDDPGGLLAPHAAGALVASIGAAIFAGGAVAERVRRVGVQCVGIGSIAIVTIFVSWAAFVLLTKLTSLRVSEGDEFDGLDLAQHDMNAYPDFQQTTIKSYHLREA